MSKISGDEGCHSKNAVLRHGVFAMTGPRMLIFAYTSFHAQGALPHANDQ
jgi:hypothetical protein